MDYFNQESYPDQPHVVSQGTVDELLVEVDTRVEHRPAPVDENLRIANLLRTTATGKVVRVHIRQTPIEHSRDGSTVFINVYDAQGGTSTDYTHWNFYPDGKGGQLTTGTPVITESTLQKAIDADSAVDGLKLVLIEAQSNREAERLAGYSLATEEGTRQLIDLIRDDTGWQTPNQAHRKGFKGFLRALGLAR